jgi:hypothetical protein
MDAESYDHMPLMTNSSRKAKAHLPGLSLESPRKKEAEKQADQWHQRIWQNSHDMAKNCPNLDITWGCTSIRGEGGAEAAPKPKRAESVRVH